MKWMMILVLFLALVSVSADLIDPGFSRKISTITLEKNAEKYKEFVFVLFPWSISRGVPDLTYIILEPGKTGYPGKWARSTTLYAIPKKDFKQEEISKMFTSAWRIDEAKFKEYLSQHAISSKRVININKEVVLTIEKLTEEEFVVKEKDDKEAAGSSEKSSSLYPYGSAFVALLSVLSWIVFFFLLFRKPVVHLR